MYKYLHTVLKSKFIICNNIFSEKHIIGMYYQDSAIWGTATIYPPASQQSLTASQPLYIPPNHLFPPNHTSIFPGGSPPQGSQFPPVNLFSQHSLFTPTPQPGYGQSFSQDGFLHNPGSESSSFLDSRMGPSSDTSSYQVIRNIPAFQAI